MRKKTLIKFYTCMLLIGFNAILWAYMWQEFKQIRVKESAIFQQHPQQKIESAEKTQALKREFEKTIGPVAAYDTPYSDSSVVQTETGGEETAAFLAYERLLYETEYAGGKRDQYASLVEKQILNVQRSNEIDYTVLKDAGIVFRDISKRLSNIEIPENVSEQSKSTAHQAKILLSESYWMKADAMVLLANFLDTNDAEWKKRYERKITKSEKYKQDSLHALHIQKTKLGMSK